MTTVKPKKKQKLRNAEYFDLQDTFDKLYSESKKSKSFTSLMDIVAADENIMLAYRNISKTKAVERQVQMERRFGTCQGLQTQHSSTMLKGGCISISRNLFAV